MKHNKTDNDRIAAIVDAGAKRATSPAFDSTDEVQTAATVPVPGGVVLTDEEELFRRGSVPKAHGRRLIVARSILRKVRTACGAA